MGSRLTSESQAHNERLILGVTTATLILAILSYLLRLLARRISNARYWYDDGLMLLGLVSKPDRI